MEDVKQYFEQFGKVSSCPSEHYIFWIPLFFFFSFLFKVCFEKQKCNEACVQRRATFFAFLCNFSKPLEPFLEFLFCLLHVYVYNIANTVYLR